MNESCRYPTLASTVLVLVSIGELGMILQRIARIRSLFLNAEDDLQTKKD